MTKVSEDCFQLLEKTPTTAGAWQLQQWRKSPFSEIINVEGLNKGLYILEINVDDKTRFAKFLKS